MMSKVLTFSVLLLVSQLGFAQDCKIANLNNTEVATIKTNGAIGIPSENGGVYFGGISHHDVISGRAAEIFSYPKVWSRGSTKWCVMPSVGWSEDGVIYNFHGSFVGSVSDDGKILNNQNEVVGSYNEACAKLPANQRDRLVSGAALVTLLANSAATSGYFIGYNPETCAFANHPGSARAKVLIEPIGCPNCGYTYTVIR